MSTYAIRRRPRECKTCLPCRANKVRCDRNVPCGHCAKRNFTCSYAPPPSQPAVYSYASWPESSSPSLAQSFTSPYPRLSAPRRDASSAADQAPGARDQQGGSSEVVDISQAEWDEINAKMATMERIVGSLHSLFQAHTAPKRHGRQSDEPSREREVIEQTEGVYGPNVLKTGAVHLGSRSAMLDILDKSKRSEDTARALPSDDLLAELALGNESAAYPFVDLWSSEPFTYNIADVCAVLPDDDQCRRFLSFYKDIGAVLYPVLPDLAELERDMNRLLDGRRVAGGVYRLDANGLVKPFGMDLAFLGLLFAVLASGCQLSDMSVAYRRLTSWVYVSCSYQCLRALNYLSQPTVEVIQILLIITNVLSYNMNAGASYTLLGMTERLCLVLGLHTESKGFSLAAQAVRRRVWWTMAFQNSHFSLAYDRPSITMVSQPEIPFDRKSMPGHRSYFETLCRIISVALEVLRSRMFPESSNLRFHEIREYVQLIRRILAEATQHLRYQEYCQSLSEHIERTELRLHSSYLLSNICRVSLDPHTHLDEQRRTIMRKDCIDGLMDTINAFVELHEINSHCSRSWISLQRSISSAFLLVANDDSPQTWELIDRLELVLADHVYADDNANHNNRTESAKHLSSSLRALREIRDTFRARKAASATPAAAANPSPLALPSPPSTDTSRAGLPTLATATASVSSIKDRSMRNILGRVSDIMLFPSMSGGHAVV